MIPVRLTLRNFLSYGDEPETLSLDGLRLFCLAGDNGHGKSAVLDAITWCIWGESRAATQDELVRAGATEMTVVLDFDLSGQRYQVLRNRKLRKGPSTTVLELRVEREGELVPLTGASVEETEASLVKLLGMAYRTFVNSAFLLQGRADEFTKKSPAERKQILAEVLNLQQFDLLERESRDRHRAARGRAEELERRIALVDAELAALPDVEAARDAAQQEFRESADALDLARDHERGLRARREALRAKEERRSELEAELGRLELEESDIAVALRARATELDAARRELAHEPELRAGYAAWREADAALAAEQDKDFRAQPLREEERSLLRQLERHHDQLQNSLVTLNDRQRELERLLQEGARAATELAALQRRMAEAAGHDEELARARDAAHAAATRIAALRATHDQLQKRLKDLRDHYKLLQPADASCPVCNSPLDPTRKRRLNDGMKAEADGLKTQAARHEQEILQVERQRKGHEERIATLQELLRGAAGVSQRIGSLEQQVRGAREATAERDETQRQLSALEAQLRDAAYLPDAREKLAAVRGAIAAIGYDPDEHRRAVGLRRQLESFQDAPVRIERAQRQEAEALSALAHLDASRAALESRRSAAVASLGAVRKELEVIPALEAELAAKALEVATAEARQRAAIEAVGRAEQQLKHLRARRDERKDLSKDLGETKEREAISAELVTAFGKNGVQAMIIEQAIPAIQDEANRLLDVMSDHQMSVSLETQRLGRTGDVKETLDVKISDQSGARRYELFSGGEAFRVDLALRIALSRYLAQRAGSRLQTLVIDEGFGSQDSKGRDRLVEALNSIRGDFEKIMVITHVDDLKEAFPNRVDVVKDERGSHFLVAAG